MLVVLAIVLVVVAAILVPQPRIRLTGVRYQTTPCDLATTTFVATAIVTLTNEGAGDGAIIVRFYADGQMRAMGNFFVPGHRTLERALDAMIGDCAYHRYSVDTLIPPSEGFHSSGSVLDR
ncbi:MAG TPA: hypothetical protein VEO20_05290 [Thermoplasmata archaeon]|nr:hypothetical protein [Thermoplasmata archaeon]